MNNPTIEKGDVILGGKFRNIPYTVESFEKDDNNQPVIVTTSGKRIKMFPFRLQKLMKKKKTEEVSLKLKPLLPSK